MDIKKIVSQLTDEVVERLKEDGEFDEGNQAIPQNSQPSYIKLTKVNNGFILDMNTDDPLDQPMTEVIEVEDISDPDAISGILYGVAEWLGIEYLPNSNENLNISFDGVGETFNPEAPTPPSPLNQSKIDSSNIDDYNQKRIMDQAPPITNENIVKPMEDKTDVSKKPHELTKEDVIRAAMGLPPENTIHEDELSPAEKLGVNQDDWELDEDELEPNQWAEADLKAQEYEDLTNEQYKELEDAPDGDFDEDADGDYDDGYED